MTLRQWAMREIKLGSREILDKLVAHVEEEEMGSVEQQVARLHVETIDRAVKELFTLSGAPKCGRALTTEDCELMEDTLWCVGHLARNLGAYLKTPSVLDAEWIGATIQRITELAALTGRIEGEK